MRHGNGVFVYFVHNAHMLISLLRVKVHAHINHNRLATLE